MNTSTSYRKQIRNASVLLTTFALSLGLIVTGHAHNAQISQLNGSADIDRNAIRPFRVNIPEKSLIDLRRRIADTRGRTAEEVLLSRPHRRLRRSRFLWQSRYSPTRFIEPRRHGPGGPIATWSTSMRPTEVDISPRGNSRSFSLKSFGQLSDRFAQTTLIRLLKIGELRGGKKWRIRIMQLVA